MLGRQAASSRHLRQLPPTWGLNWLGVCRCGNGQAWSNDLRYLVTVFFELLCDENLNTSTGAPSRVRTALIGILCSTRDHDGHRGGCVPGRVHAHQKNRRRCTLLHDWHASVRPSKRSASDAWIFDLIFLLSLTKMPMNKLAVLMRPNAALVVEEALNSPESYANDSAY